MLYTRGRQPMARGPNVALFKKTMALFKKTMALFKKTMALFKIRGAKKREKKVIKKNLGVVKKARVNGPQQKVFLIFPFFGPPSTKGWRPLLYTV